MEREQSASFATEIPVEPEPRQPLQVGEISLVKRLHNFQKQLQHRGETQVDVYDELHSQRRMLKEFEEQLQQVQADLQTLRSDLQHKGYSGEISSHLQHKGSSGEVISLLSTDVVVSKVEQTVLPSYSIKDNESRTHCFNEHETIASKTRPPKSNMPVTAMATTTTDDTNLSALHSMIPQQNCEDTEEMSDKIGRTCYTAIFLLCRPDLNLSIFEKALLIFLFAFSFFLQLSFTLFVIFLLNDLPFGGRDGIINDLEIWRFKWSHRWDLATQETAQSHISSVCNQQPSVYASGMQYMWVHSLQEYLGLSQTDFVEGQLPSRFVVEYPGCVLVMLCLVLWLLPILHEVRCTIRLFLALISGPSESHARHSRVSVSGINIAASLTVKHRMIAICLIVLPRLYVAIALVSYGTQFLVYTIEISEMILNSMALKFLLEIDEMFFKYLIPGELAALVKRLEPIPIRPRFARAWKKYEGIVFLCGFFVTLFMCIGFFLFPMVDRLRHVYETMCGGDVHFIYSQDGLSLWPRFSDTPIMNDLTEYEPEILLNNISNIVKFRAWAADRTYPSETRAFTSQVELSGIKQWSERGISEWQFKRWCIDDDQAISDIVLLRAPGNLHISGCTELTTNHCRAKPTRIFCPNWCFCDDLRNFSSTEKRGGIVDGWTRACCSKLEDTKLRASCQDGTQRDMDAVFFENLLRPAGESVLRWWLTCVDGFEGCPETCSYDEAEWKRVRGSANFNTNTVEEAGLVKKKEGNDVSGEDAWGEKKQGNYTWEGAAWGDKGK